MTHPRDRVYHFATAEHWGAGAASNLRVEARPGGDVLCVPGRLSAERLSGSTRADRGVLLALDPAARLVWLRRDGTLLVHDAGRALHLGDLPERLAARARRLLWGQATGWLLTETGLVRLDTETSRDTGRFDAAGWTVAGIAEDTCDGVIAVETDGKALRLRRIRADGRVRTTPPHEIAADAVSVPHRAAEGSLAVAVTASGGKWRLHFLPVEGGEPRALDFTGAGDQTPGGPVAQAGPRRLTYASSDRTALFGVDGGVLEPLETPDLPGRFGEIVDLIESADGLVAATTTGVYRIVALATAGEPRTAAYVTPVLRSPLGERSGWLRADLRASLPQGGEVQIATRGFDRRDLAEAALAGYRAKPETLEGGWAGTAPSRHVAEGTADGAAFLHYLGEVKQEFLLLRVAVTVPADGASATLHGLDVLYPNRSLIEELPAIYRDGGRSERQMRRILAPFQAMVDDIDDRITAGAARLDPETADDAWTGFLLGWLGHPEFARLGASDRRDLLRALPGILRNRGTVAALAAVLDILAPEGYAIEDAGTGPEDWMLGPRHAPAGARLARGTRITHNAPPPLRLGGCLALGAAVLHRGCPDPEAASPCSGAVTVRIFGGPEVRERIEPFTDAIARAVAPAHTRLRFVFGAHRPDPGLERGGDRLGDLTLDSGDSRALGAWRVAAVSGPGRPDPGPVLDRMRLTNALTLA